MRVQRAVAVALLSLCVGCAQTALRKGPEGQAEVVWGVRQPGVSPLVAEESSGAASSWRVPSDESDPAEAFLAGSQSLWPETDPLKIASRANRLRLEMGGKLRQGIAASGRYMEIIEREFQREGVPVELAFLPLIESNFEHLAVGSGAVGLWQLTAGTAQRYGLIVNRDIDERRDPEKASRAAARLLRDLHDHFDRWDLAIAAYNAGPGPIERALERNPGADFWKLADRGLLPGHTREYVPKVLATAFIASRPESFGFADVDRYEPLRYDTYVVSRRLDVATIASLCGSTRTEVAELNPSLRKGVVPSLPSGYQVRLPKGTGERFAVQYAAWQNGRPIGDTPGRRSAI